MSKGYICPDCASDMEVAISGPRLCLRVCPHCKLIQWEDGGVTETRRPALKPPEAQAS